MTFFTRERLLWLLLLAAALFASNADAKGYAPVVTQTATGVAVATRANAQAVAVLARVGSNVNATSNIIATIAKGVKVDAVVTGAVTGASRGGAVGAAIGALGVVGVAALPWLVDAALRSGVKTTSDGFRVPDPSACTVGPCYGYPFGGTIYPSGEAACKQLMSVHNAPDGFESWEFISYDPPTGECWAKTYLAPGQMASPAALVGHIGRIEVSPAAGGDRLASPAEVISQIAANPVEPTVAEVQGLVDLGYPPEVAPASITGPATVGDMNTVKLGLDGAQQTETCKFYLEYFPSNIKAHPECSTTTVTPPKTETKQVTTTNPDGTTSTQTVTTTTPGSTVTTSTVKDKVDAADKEDPQTCGLPGSPACKIDETGTPEALPAKPYDASLDQYKTDQAALRTKVGGPEDKGFFNGWSNAFITPPLAACTPFELPRSMGSLDPCPVVDGVRAVMAYLWAITALWFCLGMIREVV